MHEDPMAVLRRDGYVILRSVIPADEVGRVRRSVAATVSQAHQPGRLPQGYVTGFLRLNQAIAPYLNHPRIMAIVDELFGNNARISNAHRNHQRPRTSTWNGPRRLALQTRTSSPASGLPIPDVILNLVTMWMIVPVHSGQRRDHRDPGQPFAKPGPEERNRPGSQLRVRG